MSDERPAEPEAQEHSLPPYAPEAPPAGVPAQPGAIPPPPLYAASQKFERGRPIPIKDMRVGEILDAAIKLYRFRWKTFLGTAAFVIVPISFLQSFFTRENLGGLGDAIRGIEPSGAEPSTTAIVATLVFSLITYLFVFPFMTAAFAKVTTDLYGGGEPEIAETYRFALTRTRSILWVSILTGLAVVGGFILLIVPAIIFAIRFIFATAIVVTENLRGTDALRRSWRLCKGFFWKTFGTLLLARLLSGIIGALVSLPLTLGANFIGPAAWPLAAIGSSLGQVLTVPFATVVVVLLYFDLRIRKEGLDLAMMVDAMSAPEN